MAHNKKKHYKRPNAINMISRNCFICASTAITTKSKRIVAGIVTTLRVFARNSSMQNLFIKNVAVVISMKTNNHIKKKYNQWTLHNFHHRRNNFIYRHNLLHHQYIKSISNKILNFMLWNNAKPAITLFGFHKTIMLRIRSLSQYKI